MQRYGPLGPAGVTEDWNTALCIGEGYVYIVFFGVEF